MEKRLARPLNLATVAQYGPVFASMIKLAGECTAETAKGKAAGFNFQAANANFSMATFINCCLDRMGVGEVDTTIPHLKSFNFDPDKIADPILVDKLKRQARDPSGWSNDLKAIASCNSSARLFIQRDGKARRSAVILAVFERNKGSELTVNESKFILQKAAPPILKLIQKCGYKSDMADVSFSSIVSLATSAEPPKVEEAARRKVAPEFSTEQNLPLQLYKIWSGHIRRFAPDFDITGYINQLETESACILPLVDKLWNYVQDDKEAFLYSRFKPTTPWARWEQYSADKLTDAFKDSGIKPEEIWRTKALVTSTITFFSRFSTDPIGLCKKMIALSSALNRQVKPDTNELVLFIESQLRHDVPFDLDMFYLAEQIALRNPDSEMKINLHHINLNPKLLELSAQALVYGAAAQTLIDKTFAGINIQKPYPVELLGGQIGTVGTRDQSANHRNFGILLDKSPILKQASLNL